MNVCYSNGFEESIYSNLLQMPVLEHRVQHPEIESKKVLTDMSKRRHDALMHVYSKYVVKTYEYNLD